MADRDLTYQDLLQILQLVEESEQFSDFRLKYGDIELELRKHGAPSLTAPLAGNHADLQPSKPASVEIGSTPAANPMQGGEGSPQAEPSEDAIIIKSPMVGTFYRSPEPGASPFVSVGQRVEADSVVCILEVMKLMNSIPAGTAGVITKILVGDGEAVEFGQPLIVIDPIV